MKSITESIKKNQINESKQIWCVDGQTNRIGWPSMGGEFRVPVDNDAYCIELYLGSPCIRFLSENDIVEIDEENGLGGKFEKTIKKLKRGEAYTDKTDSEYVYVKL